MKFVRQRRYASVTLEAFYVGMPYEPYSVFLFLFIIWDGVSHTLASVVTKILLVVSKKSFYCPCNEITSQIYEFQFR